MAQPTRAQDNKVVMSKLSREDFNKLQKHCELKKESVNALIRRVILHEIDVPLPHMLAGKNIFVYNRYKDNFSWRVMLDTGLRVDVEDNLSAEYVSQVYEELGKAIDERDTYIKKEEKSSVPVPNKIIGRPV